MVATGDLNRGPSCCPHPIARRAGAVRARRGRDRSEAGIEFAYADPPYFGLAGKFYGHLHPNAADYDRIETHAALIERLEGQYPDGWALSLHSPSLKHILPLCPDRARVMPWIKPFCSFKPGVGVAYTWEPLIVAGGRKRTREQSTVRDWVSENITLRRGFTGAKPAGVVRWLLEVLNVQPGDTVDDLFPGSGAVGGALAGHFEAQSGNCSVGLFATAAA